MLEFRSDFLAGEFSRCMFGGITYNYTVAMVTRLKKSCPDD